MIAFDQSCWLVRRRAKRENGSSFSDREIERLLGGALAPAVQHMLEFSSAVYFAAHVDEDGGWEGEPPLFSPVPLPFDPAKYQIVCRHGIRGKALLVGNRSIDDICPAIPDCEECKMLATALVQGGEGKAGKRGGRAGADLTKSSSLEHASRHHRRRRDDASSASGTLQGPCR